MAETYEEWNAAKTFTNLIGINKKYLQGEEPYAPYKLHKTNRETHELMLRLLNLGIFPYSNQQYRQYTTKRTNGYCELLQKPYVSFIVAKDPSKILQRLGEVTGVAVFGVLLRPFKVLNNPGELIVTKCRSAGSIQALRDAVWEIRTVIEARVVSHEDLFSLNFFQQNEAWAIDVAAAEWGVEMNLLQVIDGACRDEIDNENMSNKLDKLPSEIFSAIAQHLPLEDIKHLSLLNSTTRDLAEYALKQYYRIVTVNVGLNAASHLQRFFNNTLSKYTETVIIREHSRFTDWRDAGQALELFRSTLDSVGREINVVFRSCERGVPGYFLDAFDNYEWPIKLENIWASKLKWADFSAAQSIELVLPRPFKGCPRGTILEAEEGLLSFTSKHNSSKELSVVHERHLSADEELVLESLKSKGIQVKKTYVDPKLKALMYFEADLQTTLTRHLQQRGILNETKSEQCYVDILNDCWLCRGDFMYSSRVYFSLSKTT